MKLTDFENTFIEDNMHLSQLEVPRIFQVIDEDDVFETGVENNSILHINQSSTYGNRSRFHKSKNHRLRRSKNKNKNVYDNTAPADYSVDFYYSMVFEDRNKSESSIYPRELLSAESFNCINTFSSDRFAFSDIVEDLDLEIDSNINQFDINNLSLENRQTNTSINDIISEENYKEPPIPVPTRSNETTPTFSLSASQATTPPTPNLAERKMSNASSKFESFTQEDLEHAYCQLCFDDKDNKPKSTSTPQPNHSLDTRDTNIPKHDKYHDGSLSASVETRKFSCNLPCVVDHVEYVDNKCELVRNNNSVQFNDTIYHYSPDNNYHDSYLPTNFKASSVLKPKSSQISLNRESVKYCLPYDSSLKALDDKGKQKIILRNGIVKRKRVNKGGQKVMTQAMMDKFIHQTKFILNPEFESILRLKPALAESIKCEIDYKQYKGDNVIILDHFPELSNTATTVGICKREKLLSMSTIKCSSKRVKYSRDLTTISKSVTNLIYIETEGFDCEHPYNPQWVRCELDLSGDIIFLSKCGLCPYCPTIKFFGYRNGGYLGHLACDHGICSNNYLVPDGINFGLYKLPKSDNDSTLIVTNGLECPYCHEAIKVGAQKDKNELLPYFRHWKKYHKSVKISNLMIEMTGHSRQTIAKKK